MDQINATMTENELINQTALEPDTGACPAGSETYRVQRGDSFYLIARKFGISVRLMNASEYRGRHLLGAISSACRWARVPAGGFFCVHRAAGASVVDVMLSSNVSLRRFGSITRIWLTALPRRVLYYCRWRNEDLRKRRAGLPLAGRRHAG
ncbi:MAG: LysM peptidoglycan-binding domain-containing protein [Christensenellales bacterium]